jgi:hypothetical protein
LASGDAGYRPVYFVDAIKDGRKAHGQLGWSSGRADRGWQGPADRQVCSTAGAPSDSENIRQIWTEVKAAEHAREVLAVLEQA